MVISASEFLRIASEDKETRFLAVIGNPVSHSRSPELHSTIYSVLNIKARYFALPFETPESLYFFLDECEKRSNIPGFNITIPFKETVFKKYRTEKLLPVSSVNTLVHNGDKFSGENTDWIGFVEPVKTENLKSALILGWGGAAKGVVYGLQSIWPDCKISVVSRKKQENLPGVSWILSDYNHFSVGPDHTDIIINTTPLGMTGKTDDFSEEFLNRLPETSIAYDIIYTPAETRFLSFFRKKSTRTQNGLSMFIGQALASHEKWFGPINEQIKPDLTCSLSRLLQP